MKIYKLQEYVTERTYAIGDFLEIDWIDNSGLRPSIKRLLYILFSPFVVIIYVSFLAFIYSVILVWLIWYCLTSWMLENPKYTIFGAFKEAKENIRFFIYEDTTSYKCPKCGKISWEAGEHSHE